MNVKSFKRIVHQVNQVEMVCHFQVSISIPKKKKFFFYIQNNFDVMFYDEIYYYGKFKVLVS